MTQFSISALNDWADRKADAAAHKNRPLPLGRVSATTALIMAIGFAAASIAGAVPLGVWAVLILVVGLAAGWSYDLFLKPTPFSFVPFGVAFPLLVVWTSTVAGQPVRPLGLIFAAGVPLAVAIHLADAIPDRLEDAKAGLRTPAVVIGAPAAELLAGTLLLVGIAVTDVALWRQGKLSPSLLAPLSPAGLYFTYALNRSSSNPRLSRQLAKWFLVLAAVATGFALTLLRAND